MEPIDPTEVIAVPGQYCSSGSSVSLLALAFNQSLLVLNDLKRQFETNQDFRGIEPAINPNQRGKIYSSFEKLYRSIDSKFIKSPEMQELIGAYHRLSGDSIVLTKSDTITETHFKIILNSLQSFLTYCRSRILWAIESIKVVD